MFYPSFRSKVFHPREMPTYNMRNTPSNVPRTACLSRFPVMHASKRISRDRLLVPKRLPSRPRCTFLLFWELIPTVTPLALEHERCQVQVSRFTHVLSNYPDQKRNCGSRHLGSEEAVSN